jgi:uncharacterized protein with beta-barrel porin domain
MLAGVDYRLTPHLAVGLFGGYSHTWTDLRPGHIDTDSGRGGIYATYFDPTGWWVNVGGYGGYNSYDTSRAVFGQKLGHDSLLIKAGVLYQLNPRISISIMYDGQVARTNYDSHSVTGVFSYSF